MCAHCISFHLCLFKWCLQTHFFLFPFLSSLIWAKCGITSSGCLSIRNFTIRFMPIPIIDASQALKASPEKTEDALLKVWPEFFLVPSSVPRLSGISVANILNSTTLRKSEMIDDIIIFYLITLVFYDDSVFYDCPARLRITYTGTMKPENTCRSRPTDCSRALWPQPHSRCVNNLIHSHRFVMIFTGTCMFSLNV